MQELEFNDWVAIGSSALALASFVLNWALVRRQADMQFESLKAQMDADVLAWAHECIEALTEAAGLAHGRGVVYAPETLRERAPAALGRLSALADRGRLYFPNYAPNEQGGDKEGAFRGFRPPVLDCLIFAYQKLSKMDLRNLEPDLETEQFIVRCRRAFVSDIQRAVDPRRRSRMMRKLAAQKGNLADQDGVREAAALGEALERAHPGSLAQPRDEAWTKAMAARAGSK